MRTQCGTLGCTFIYQKVEDSMLKIFIAFLLMMGVANAETVMTARGPREINDGDIVPFNSMWEGQIKNLKDVTFIGWNFSRKTPHTKVFNNCTNLTFIDCNLNNVELQADFTTHGSLTIHQREYELGGKNYREVECGDNKTRTYEMTEEDVDIIERDFGSLTKTDKDKIKAKYDEDGVSYIEHTEEQILTDIKDTPNDKKIEAIRISPNDTRFDHLRK